MDWYKEIIENKGKSFSASTGYGHTCEIFKQLNIWFVDVCYDNCSFSVSNIKGIPVDTALVGIHLLFGYEFLFMQIEKQLSTPTFMQLSVVVIYCCKTKKFCPDAASVFQ